MITFRLRHSTFAFALWLLATAVAPVSAQAPSPSTSPTTTPSCPAAEPRASAAAASTGAADLTVYAAASLRDAFESLAAPWEAAHPGSELILSFDASSTLRTQIEEGAPADVFASADTRNAQLLVDACLAPEPVIPFAGNALVVVVPAGNPAGISSPADLARAGVRVVAALPDVPITRYASELIANLAALPDYPADFAAAVAANTVSEEDNVRAVLAKVELGEADAAIVYITDAETSDSVERVEVPDQANVPATYAAVPVGDSVQPEAASGFLAFLTGPEAQAALAEFGFLPAS